jgi:hypothetical protein
MNADIATAKANGWGLAFEGGWAQRDDFGPVKIYNLAAGPRWSYRRPRVAPFVQVLGGVEFANADRVVNGVALKDNDSAFMLEPGVGVHVPFGTSWGLFVQGDGRYVFFREELDEQFRFVFGARFSVR